MVRLGANPLRLPAPGRVVAIGDVHGDAAAFRRTLRNAGLIDDPPAGDGQELTIELTYGILNFGRVMGRT